MAVRERPMGPVSLRTEQIENKISDVNHHSRGAVAPPCRSAVRCAVGGDARTRRESCGEHQEAAEAGLHGQCC